MLAACSPWCVELLASLSLPTTVGSSLSLSASSPAHVKLLAPFSLPTAVASVVLVVSMFKRLGSDPSSSVEPRPLFSVFFPWIKENSRTRGRIYTPGSENVPLSAKYTHASLLLEPIMLKDVIAHEYKKGRHGYNYSLLLSCAITAMNPVGKKKL